MPQSPILVPFFGMLLLTFAVWLLMYFHRLRAIQVYGIDPQSLAVPEGTTSLPSRAVNPSNNLKNLFELPVLFYVVVLFLLQAGQADAFHTACAYGFFSARVVHSGIHCTVNRVVHRFSAYLIASFCLWVMIVRTVLVNL